ncbi:hypothetical protein K435DRAFT_809553 [Dendrothele bispora CBS 962.96]|uniref:Uncharacterized protein n=1 Tax=Dendrothele bispora (strain CBS 962.96) TaxID=1314807 RepID=A0A4S8KY21_DENBC|nr:hypothetical protein K435DRAFT_809553 [Dendrothele bispora CBS 962.96]
MARRAEVMQFHWRGVGALWYCFLLKKGFSIWETLQVWEADRRGVLRLRGPSVWDLLMNDGFLEMQHRWEGVAALGLGVCGGNSEYGVLTGVVVYAGRAWVNWRGDRFQWAVSLPFSSCMGRFLKMIRESRGTAHYSLLFSHTPGFAVCFLTGVDFSTPVDLDVELELNLSRTTTALQPLCKQML